MAPRHQLAASERTLKGKEVKRLRREGITPGIVYGPVVESPVSVSVDTRELDRLYYGYGSNTLIDLSIDGTTYVVYMRTIDIDRIARRPRHAEFYAPNLRNAISVNIPITLVGEPENTRGVVTRGHETVELRGLPEQLPSSLELDISGLAEYDQTLHVSDLDIPGDVELVTSPDEMIVKLSAPALVTTAEEEAAEEIAEGEVAAPGAEVVEVAEEQEDL